MMICAVREDFPIPNKVILSHDKCGSPKVALDVIYTKAQSFKYNFTVCLHQPLFGVGDGVVPRLLEWIAVNRVFGADRFVLYTVNQTNFFQKRLKGLHVVDADILEFYKWEIDFPRHQSDDSHSQKAVINDCIYRHMYSSRRIVLLDFDEFPTPHLHRNWAELLDEASNKNNACDTAAYFRNSFFSNSIRWQAKPFWH